MFTASIQQVKPRLMLQQIQGVLYNQLLLCNTTKRSSINFTGFFKNTLEWLYWLL